MTQTMTVTALQLPALDITEDAARLCLTHRVQAQAADLICVPELCVQAEVGPENYNQAVVDQAKQLFSDLARAQKAYLVLGSLLEKSGGVFVNRSYLFDPKGEIAGWYDKKNLDRTDAATASGTMPPQCFTTPWGKIGLLICRDLLYPQATQALAALGADIVICAAAWCAWAENYPREYLARFSLENPPREVDVVVAARALENGVGFVFVNQAGARPGKIFLGRSQIAVPFYGTIARLEHNQEQALTAVIDLELIRSAKSAYGFSR